ncbi:MAG: glycosyltransferase family 2 protein [Candidatus Omnitrophica bacterium]|nr:glycosyltransferase family 2 protein [Candidatus Omnitrophota bacterium]
MKKGISAVIVVKNEEAGIRACLERLLWVDEIVVVDNHSTDRTVEICRSMTQVIITSESPFTGIRVNKGIERASYEWVLNVDADEIVTGELRDEIKRMVAADGASYDAFYVPVRHHFMGRALKRGGWSPCHTLRFYRKQRARYTAADHQVQVSVEGKKGYLSAALIHCAPLDTHTFLRKMNLYTSNTAAEHYRTRPVSFRDLVLLPPWVFFKRFVLRMGFLDGFPGFVIAYLGALYIFIEKVKLREAQKVTSCLVPGYGCVKPGCPVHAPQRRVK